MFCKCGVQKLELAYSTFVWDIPLSSGVYRKLHKILGIVDAVPEVLVEPLPTAVLHPVLWLLVDVYRYVCVPHTGPIKDHTLCGLLSDLYLILFHIS